jgi:hypothetical protein
MKYLLKNLVFGLLLLIICQINANAQIWVPTDMYDNPAFKQAQYQANMNAIVNQSNMNNLMIANAVGSKGNRNNGQPAAKTDWTGFNSDGKLITPQLMANNSKGSVKDKADIVRFFTQGISLYIDAAREDNFSVNDLSFAFTYFIFSNYHIYNNVNDITIKKYYKDVAKMPFYVNYGQKKAMRLQLESYLNSQPGIKKLTDREKQTFVEMLAIIVFMPKAMESKALETNDTKLLDEARQMAKKNLESLLKVDIDKLEFDKQGVHFN